MTLRINEHEYTNVDMIIANGEITCTFPGLADEDIAQLRAATFLEELENNEVVNSYVLVHWKQVSYMQDSNAVAIIWQTHFNDDVAQLRGEVRDITVYYKNNIEAAVASINAQLPQINNAISSLNTQIADLQVRVGALEATEQEPGEIIEP